MSLENGSTPKEDARRQKRGKGFFAIVLNVFIVLALGVGMYVVIENLLYYRDIEARRNLSTQALVEDAKNQLQGMIRDIGKDIRSSLNENGDPEMHAAAFRRVEERLQHYADAVIELAVKDRSASLDNVFERFSALVAIVTVIFAAIGIFSGLQFRDQLNNLRAEMEQSKANLEAMSTATISRVNHQQKQISEHLDEAVRCGQDLVWHTANTLEKLLNAGIVDEKRTTETLEYLYKVGFRLELYSPKKHERMSALHNLWAQGDCADLPNLIHIWRNAEVDSDERNLARRAVENILKRCAHSRGHSELDL